MIVHETLALGIASAATATVNRTTSAQGNIVLKNASYVDLISCSVTSKVMTANNRILKLNAADVLWNTIAPAPTFELWGYSGYFVLTNQDSAEILLPSQFTYTPVSGTQQAKNTWFMIPLDFHYVPREPIRFILTGDQLGVWGQIFWNNIAGYASGDAGNVQAFFFINLELMVEKL